MLNQLYRLLLSSVLLTLFGLFASPFASAAVTANITLNDFAAFQVNNPGRNSHMQVLLLRSDTQDHQNTRVPVFQPQFTANGTRTSTTLTAGYYTVVAYHNNYASAIGCTTVELSSYQHQYFADGSTINITVTCTMPDTTAPLPSSADTSVDGTTVSLVFDESIDYYGDLSEFVIKVAGNPVTISAAEFDSDRTFTFTVSPAITASQTVTISLPADSEVYDYGFNQSSGFTDFAVTNHVVNSTPAGSLVFAASQNSTSIYQLFGYNVASQRAGLVMADNKFGGSGPKGQTYLFDNKVFGFFAAANGEGGFGYFDGNSLTILEQLDSAVDPRVQSFTSFQGHLYFTATNDEGLNYHLWRYNPQDQSVTKISAAMNYVNSTAVEVYNNKLYFGGSYTGTVNNPSKLFYWDGSSITEAPGFASGAATPRFMKSYNGYLYMSASPANLVLDTELYRYTDSAGGSVAKVAELTPSGNNNGSSTISFFTLFDNKLFFSVAYDYQDGRLYSVDSNNNVNVEYNPPLSSNPNQPADLVVVDNKLYFQSVVSTTNREIIRYNSTGNVSVLTTFNPATTTVSSLVGYDGDLYFNIVLGQGRELAKLDLSNNTVTQLTNINSAGDSLTTQNMLVLPFELAPVVRLAQNAGYFSVGGSAVTPLGQVEIEDIDGDGNLDGAQLQLQNYQNGDVLDFTNQLGITGNFDSNNGRLTLSGNTTFANYQTALATVAFNTSSLVSGDRALVVRLLDSDGNLGSSNSPAATFTIRVTDKTLINADFNTQPVGLDKSSDAPAAGAGNFSLTAGALGTLNFIATNDSMNTSFGDLTAVDGSTDGIHGFVWNDQQYAGVDSLRVISNYTSPSAVAFATANGANFDFDSFAVWDDGELNSGSYYAQIRIVGYRDDTQVADQLVAISLLKPARVLLNSDFDDVDEVRIRYYDPIDPTTIYPYFWGLLDDFTILQSAADVTAPTITSIVRQSPATAATASDTLTWRITFNETVTQVSTDDFVISGSTAVVSSISAVSGSVYEVTVSGGDLAQVSGTITLSLAQGQNIQDSAQNALTDLTVSGSNESTYELDNTPPIITEVSIPNSPLKIGDQVTVTIRVAADSDNFSLIAGSVAGYSLSGLTKVNNTTYTASFTVSAGSDISAVADLAVSVQLKDSLENNSAIFDTAIHQNADAIDATRPTLVSVQRSNPTAEVTSADTVTWLVTFSESMSGVSTADFQLFSTSTATITDVSSNNNTAWLVQASGGDLASYNGYMALQLAAGYSISDVAGNQLLTPSGGQAIGGAQSFQLDNEAPLTPFDLGLELASDCGVSTSDGKTNDNTPTVLGKTSVSGAAEVTLYRDGHILLGSTDLFDCGAWGITSSQLSDGIHQLTAIAVDAAGNISGTSAALEVLIDTVAPTAIATASDVTSAQNGDSSYSFTISYSDSSSGMDVSSFDSNDVVVTGPNNYQASANVLSTSGGVVTYGITPPNGSWDQADVGSYSISLAASQVADIAGNFVAANSSLGSFSVSFNDAPINTVLPTVTGSYLVTAILNGTSGSWTDNENDPITYLYQWYRASDANGTAATAIANANTSSYTLTSADAHMYIRLVVTVDDSQGNNSTTAASAWTLVQNTAPVNTTLPVLSGQSLVLGTLSTNTGTFNDGDADTLTYSYQWYRADDGSGQGLTLIANATASTYTINTADAHKYLKVIVTADDGQGGTATASSALQLVVNAAPTLSGSPATTVAQGVLYSFSAIAIDNDADTVSFSISNKPAWLSFNPQTGALTGTPGNSDVGDYSNIVISVSDGVETVSLPAFNLSVSNVNDAPVISGSAATTVAQGVAYSFTPTAVDVDANTTLTFSISNKPAWLSFDPQTGALTGTPGNSDVGDYSNIVISVSDGVETVSLPAFNLSVSNVNDAPVISGSPALSVIANSPYSFVPVATDLDSDELTFSINNKPSWAQFDPTTGRLSGTPQRSDIGITSAITISVSDATLSAALPPFELQVLTDNTAPVAVDADLSLNEDESLVIRPTVSDAENDVLSLEIFQAPEHGDLVVEGATLRYTPAADFNGQDSFLYIAKDQVLSSEPATIQLTVNAVNDPPIAVGDQYNLVRTENDSYLLKVLANDTDIDGDRLSIDGASSSVGVVTFNADGLQLKTPMKYVGEIILRYTITDGQKGRASAEVKLVITGQTAAELPVLTLPADIEVNATALFTRVSLGVATAVDSRGQPLPVSLLTGTTFFAPGEHLAYWQATDSAGQSVTKAQKVKVKPLVSLSKDATVTEGSQTNVQILLNGPSPVYPLTIPYTVSGNSDGQDHSLVSGEVVLQSGTMIEIPVEIYSDGRNEGNETIVIELDTTINRGAKSSTVLTISEQNVAPQASLAVSQQNENRLSVSQDQGDVTVTASASDANPADVLQLSWNSGELVDVTIQANQLRFSATAQAPGVYPVQLTVTDNGSPALSQTVEVYILVQPRLPVLTQNDSDGDLIPDDEEGFADTDGDGIADYLDAISACNVVPEIGSQQVRFLAEGEPGICLRRGQISAVAESGGLQLAVNEVAADPSALNVGGVFDFIAYGLPIAGQAYQLVLPQQKPIPANAIYRKFYSDRGWTDFISDNNNFVSSYKGERGFCPPPGAAEWTPGLTEGHWCVQVTLTDGGPNDADGIRNNAIVDPGGVAVELTSNHLPTAQPDTAMTRTGFAVEIDALSNDSDADQDLLTISQASSQFGQVQILASQKLLYTPAAGFFGQDTLIYSVTDGQGGTDSSEITVTVQPNKIPVTVDDQAATDDRTPISIEVLKNDADPDGDVLSLVSAVAVQGTVTVVNSSTIRYQPKTGFAGTDIVTYVVEDNYGARSSAKVTITLQAYQEVMVINKAKGGASSGWLCLLLLPLALLRRWRWLLLMFPFVSHANWYSVVEVGQSQARRSYSEILQDIKTGEIQQFDKRDFSFGLGAGYRFHPQLSTEIVWRDFGKADLQLRQSTLDPFAYHQQVSQVSPYLGESLAFGGRWQIQAYQQWQVEILAGVQRWRTEVSSVLKLAGVEQQQLTSKFNGYDLYYGASLGYQWSMPLQVQLQLIRSQLHSNQINHLAIRFSWQF